MIAAIVLILACIAYRIVVTFWGGGDSGLFNFAPLGAIALCGAAFLPKRWALALPLAAIFLSDIVLNLHYGFGAFDGAMVWRYGALAMICGIGFLLRKSPRLWQLLIASAAGSVLFYTLANTGSWITDPAYAKTLGGWAQSMTVGLPGFPPSWMFFRNTLISDLLFTTAFVACVAWSRRGAHAAARNEVVQSA